MDFALCFAALLFFSAGHPASALLLRCGLEACQRFSPRAAIALASFASLCAAAAGLLCRSRLKSVPAKQRSICAVASFVGGCIGRALLLMFTARFPGTLTLTRAQMIPLLLFALLAIHTPMHGRLPLSPVPFALLILLCSLIDGFFGAGGMAFFSLAALGGINRGRAAPSCALLMTVIAQASALLVTMLCGETQVFPGRMLTLLAAGSAIGALVCEQQKERGAFSYRLRTALWVYLVLAAASCIEQGITAG